MIRKPLTALALVPVLALGLSACGGDDKATTSATSTSTSTTTADAQASGSSAATGASSTAAGESSSAEATSSQSASTSGGGADKAYTDKELGALLDGAKIGGDKVEILNSQFQTDVKKTAYGNQLAKSLEGMTYTPASCGQATLASTKLMPNSGGVVAAGSKRFMVILRSFPSTDAAAKMVDGNIAAGKACANYTAKGASGTIKGGSQIIAIDSPTSGKETMQVSTLSVNGKTQQMATGVGHVGNVSIQVTDMVGKATQAQVQEAVEGVAKAVAANR